MTTPAASIGDAAAAALEAYKADQQAKDAAARDAALSAARTRLGEMVGTSLDLSVLSWSYVDGSVVASDGTVHLAVRPDRTVWLVSQDDDGRYTEGAQVTSLVDVARALGLA